MKTPEPQDVLRKAAERITEPGRWTKHRMFYYTLNADGSKVGIQSTCALGAIFFETGFLAGLSEQEIFAMFPSDPGRMLRWVADEATEALAYTVGASVPSWNDTPGRTAEEVAEAMRLAADRYEGNVRT